MMKKTYKYMKYISAIVFLVLGGILVGSYLERISQEQIKDALFSTTKIALVNMDEGAIYREEDRNFASEIIPNLEGNYIVTGLEDAKRGVKEGRYGAYIIIPSTFSSSVASINTDPISAQLTYEIGGNLVEQSKNEVMLGVFQAEKKINDDLGFLYLSSILSEFHTGQNSALTIMANDNKDKEVLMAITSYNLVEMIDIKEIERLQNEIENLDLVEDFETNQKLMTLVGAKYEEYLKETASELVSLKDEASDQQGKRDELFGIVEGFETLQSFFDENGLKEGSFEKTNTKLEDLNTLFNQFNDNATEIITEDNKSVISNVMALDTILQNLNKLTKKDESTVTNQDGEGETVFKKLTDQMNQMVTGLSDQKDKVGNIMQSYDIQALDSDLTANFAIKVFNKYQEAKRNQGGQTGTDPFVQAIDSIFVELDNHRVFQSKLNEYFQSLNIVPNSYTFESYFEYVTSNNYQSIDLTNEFDNMEKEIDSLSQLFKNGIQNPVVDMETTIQTSIQGELRNIIDFFYGRKNDLLLNEMEKLPEINSTDILKEVDNDLEGTRDQQKNYKDNLIVKFNEYQAENDAFIRNLKLYNPLEKIDSDEIASIISDYQKNVAKINNKIMDKNSEYMHFVDASYRDADEHILSLREDIQKHQQIAEEKLDQGLAQAKQVKEDTSSVNQRLMGSFVSKLPYTRVGSVENTLVYDFIVSPITMEGMIYTKSDGSSFDLLLIFLVFFVLSALLYILLYFIQMRNKEVEKKESIEDKIV